MSTAGTIPPVASVFSRAKIAVNLATGVLQQTELIVGIDLGTTNPLVSYVHPETRQPRAINHLGRGIIVPSVIYFAPDGELLVGGDVRLKLETDPAHTIHSVKRRLGRSYRDLADHLGQLGYRVVEDERDPDGLVRVRVSELRLTHRVVLKETRGCPFFRFVKSLPHRNLCGEALYHSRQRYRPSNQHGAARFTALRLLCTNYSAAARGPPPLRYLTT
ncbi:MAG: Hsp70 family protein [Hymenobacteraceae bacterium]|nr:Hsp70 family protein [Hymenobacteraceae bacterium]